MENFEAVTSYLRKQIEKDGGDVDRETLRLIKTKDGALGYTDPDGGVWRMYRFISDCYSLQKSNSKEQFASSGTGFGTFLRKLADFPAETLHEVIDKFHDTPNRYRQLLEAIEKDAFGRVASTQKDIAVALSMEQDASHLTDLLAAGDLPLRVTHNDTKINNILYDNKTNKTLCVIDLDTIMPGLVAYDFGDAIRSGASTALEDEADLSKVNFDRDLFDAYAKAYIEAAGDMLTEEEVKSLPWGAYLMTLECGVRFLTDYLSGDVYLRTAFLEHNLVRARNQFHLAKQIHAQLDALTEDVLGYAK